MTDKASHPIGHVVRVITKRLAGGEPVQDLWDVADADPEAAVIIVSNEIEATDEEVEAVEALSQSAIDALGLVPGECRKRT